MRQPPSSRCFCTASLGHQSERVLLYAFVCMLCCVCCHMVAVTTYRTHWRP
jgi:hypothetical protein